ncbi:hypothetical protein G210_5728 [Candida maltosa Xu316]|uniref:VanZ-like domain-containing protein n=1 Tax=Candida maltosa (strain Xu316) TaxID=1245528 RepID=M3K427_CANMX|nr:hypothetical protein G210_5728 [Candida maltosa Xu316]
MSHFHIVFVVTLIGAGYLGFASIHLPHDKLIHFSTFCILTIEFYFIFDTHYKSLKVLRYITLLLCTFGGSVSSEIIQNAVNPTRIFDVYDILANVIGSLVGLGLCIGFMTWKKNKAKKDRIRYRQLNTHIIGGDDDDDDDDDESEVDSTIEMSSNEDYVNIQLQEVHNNKESIK